MTYVRTIKLIERVKFNLESNKGNSHLCEISYVRYSEKCSVLKFIKLIKLCIEMPFWCHP